MNGCCRRSQRLASKRGELFDHGLVRIVQLIDQQRVRLDRDDGYGTQKSFVFAYDSARCYLCGAKVRVKLPSEEPSIVGFRREQHETAFDLRNVKQTPRRRKRGGCSRACVPGFQDNLGIRTEGKRYLAYITSASVGLTIRTPSSWPIERPVGLRAPRILHSI